MKRLNKSRCSSTYLDRVLCKYERMKGEIRKRAVQGKKLQEYLKMDKYEHRCVKGIEKKAPVTHFNTVCICIGRMDVE